MTPTTVDEVELAKFVLEGSTGEIVLRCNAIAYDYSSADNTIYVVSAAGPASAVKAHMAALQSPTRMHFRVRDHAGIGQYAKFTRPAGSKYRIYKTRLRASTWHMLAIKEEAKLMLSIDDESLWTALRNPEITTPVLRHWVPYIRKFLISKNRLKTLSGFGCEAGLLSIDTGLIDSIVAIGIQNNYLTFQEQQLCTT